MVGTFRRAVGAVTGGLVRALLVVSCHPSTHAFTRAQQLSTRGEWLLAVTYYESALRADPENIEYRAALYRARLQASYLLVARAREKRLQNDLDGALHDYETALALNPANRYLNEELSDLRRDLDHARGSVSASIEAQDLPFVGPPRIDPDSTAPLQLRFAEGSSLKTVLEALGRLAGVNVLFDESFRDTTVDFELDGVTFWEALDLLARTNRFFYKVLDSKAIQVSPEGSR
jgi:general secretion pathway protein D